MYCQVRPFLGKTEVRFLLSGPSYFSLSWFSFPLLETYISLKAFSGKYWKTIRVMGFGYEAMSYLIKQDVNNSEFKVYWFCGSYHYQISSMNFDLRLVPLGHKMAAAVPDFTFPYWAIERKNKGCSLYVCFIGERNIYQIVSRRFSPISYQNYVACYLLNKLLGQGKRLLRQIYVWWIRPWGINKHGHFRIQGTQAATGFQEITAHIYNPGVLAFAFFPYLLL